MKSEKAIPGLKQSGLLSHNQLKDTLATGGYFPSKHTNGLWLHKTRDISFTLVVDDFGVKYTHKSDADHLLNLLKASYPITIDWSGKKYIGIDLDWDYKHQQVTTSMKGYVKRALLQFKHSNPLKPFHSPSKYTPPKFGQKVQLTPQDNSEPMTDTDKLYLHAFLARSNFPQISR